MDLNGLNRQLNDTVNYWLAAMKEYFSHLSRNEQYGWLGLLVGVILVVTGIFFL